MTEEGKQRRFFLIAFGLSCAFVSSFGQTFVISLFLPSFMQDLSINKYQFGLIYTVASVLAALAMLRVGPILTAGNSVRYAAIAIGLLATGSCGLFLAANWIVLATSIFVLRLSGQGMISHISSTTMAREFSRRRGRALGMASLGYALGEAALPASLVFLIGFEGWRNAWLTSAVLIALILLPLNVVLGKRALPSTNHSETESSAVGDSRLVFQERLMLLDWRFLGLLPASAFFPFLATALFLFQTHIAASQGWSMQQLASGFAAYSLIRAGSSLCVGSLIDRLSARSIYPLYLLPCAVALLVAHYMNGVIALYGYMILLGLSAGMHGNASSATWAELYGGENVARVRSITSSLSIFAAALSPALVGWLLEHRVSVSSLLDISVIACIACCLLAAACMSQFKIPVVKRGY